jgi:hypothetical protein
MNSSYSKMKRLRLERILRNKKEDGYSSSFDNLSENIMIFDGAEDRNRTGTILKDRRILSPVRLPVPPPRHKFYWRRHPDLNWG